MKLLENVFFVGSFADIDLIEYDKANPVTLNGEISFPCTIVSDDNTFHVLPLRKRNYLMTASEEIRLMYSIQRDVVMENNGNYCALRIFSNDFPLRVESDYLIITKEIRKSLQKTNLYVYVRINDTSYSTR
jgi:hypothetical protein